MLANGITVTADLRESVLERGGVALRRNFYNSPGRSSRSSGIPQEIQHGSTVVAINDYGTDHWTLTRGDDGAPVLVHRLGQKLKAGFVKAIPVMQTPDIQSVANLYGGHALSFFSPRSCYFFAHDTQCSFCSLAGTAHNNDSISSYLSPSVVKRSVRQVLEQDVDRQIDQVMIVGGNMRDLDRGFKHHVELASAAHTSISALGRDDIRIHIATMPPRDLSLIKALERIPGIHVMFNLEVWDPDLFEKICSGKSRDYGRINMLRALEELASVLDPFHAHSALLCGLEPASSATAGALALAEMGVSPVLNVYHSDEHSRIGLGARPTFEHLAEIAIAAQQLHDRYPIRPYWPSAGRNAINAELVRGLFRSEPPSYLQE